MSPFAETVDATAAAIATAVRSGLTLPQKSTPCWLFYDEAGSELFEQITTLPEYYLTRTERALFERYADEIFRAIGSPVTIAELGAGTATKTGILLATATRFQPEVLYQPIDISPSALAEARALQSDNIAVQPQVANYITEPYRIERPEHHSILALYIGSSIGNFSPAEARAILANLRGQLRPGDYLLLGTDLAPSTQKSEDRLRAAYDDAQGVSAAFNLNILARLNRELGANFDPACFAHESRWNPVESRIENHLRSLAHQTVRIPANSAGPTLTLRFRAGETIHTENSYKFTAQSIAGLLTPTGFRPTRTFEDPDHFFAVTLAEAAEPGSYPLT